MISHKLRFIYIHPNKCGGRSIEKFFRDKKVSSMKGSDRPSNGPTKADHRSLIYWQHKYPDLYPTYFKWSIVRNPWDRIVSWWKSPMWRGQARQRKRKWKTLREYVKDVNNPGGHHLFSSRWFLDTKGKIGLDFIGKLENIEEDFKEVCDTVGIPYQKLPHVGKTKEGSPYWEYYDEESKNIIYERNKDIIERFGYEFGK